VLERNIEIGRDQALGHQRNHLIDMGIGVDIMQPHPRTQFAEFARQISHMRANRCALPVTGLMLYIHTVSRRVLADDEQFLGAGCDQFLRFAQDRIGATADQFTPDAGDDAEGTAVVAAF
jgi:hypothetical protein